MEKNECGLKGKIIVEPVGLVNGDDSEVRFHWKIDVRNKFSVYCWFPKKNQTLAIREALKMAKFLKIEILDK